MCPDAPSSSCCTRSVHRQRVRPVRVVASDAAISARIALEKINGQPPLQRSPEDILQEVLQPVAKDMETMRTNLKNVVGQRHPMLMAAAEQIFSAGETLHAALLSVDESNAQSDAQSCRRQASEAGHRVPRGLLD